MNALLQNFSPHGEFKRVYFFLQAYDRIPSTLPLDINLEANGKNAQAVLDQLDLDTFALELVFKEWHTASHKEDGKQEDFPCHFFFQSATKALCVGFDLSYDVLNLEVLYDPGDAEVEAWAVRTVQRLRDGLGRERSPQFYVLSQRGGHFFREEIGIKEADLDIASLYNDDFLEVHGVIDQAVAVDRAGLVLFHGPPGTGKTSYIKGLVSRHRDKDFIFIPNEFVQELLQPNFVSFLIAHKNAILVIEDAEKVISPRETSQGRSVVSTILQLTDGLFSDYLNIKVICTFNTSLDRVDQALLRKGRLIAFYEFGPLAPDKTNALLGELGHPGSEEALTLAEIFHFGKQEFHKRTNGKPIGFRR